MPYAARLLPPHVLTRARRRLSRAATTRCLNLPRLCIESLLTDVRCVLVPAGDCAQDTRNHTPRDHEMTEAFVAKANADAAAIVAAGGVAPVSRKQFTLYFIVEPDRVLLGMKKKGFGTGKINGFGGKVEPNDKTPRDAALRELHEEAGIHGRDPVQRGVLYFEFVGSPLIFEVFVFVSTSYDGTITETDEMKPMWFPRNAMPYDRMWLDDAQWFPHIFAGKSYRAFGLFEGHDKLLDFHLELFDDTKVVSPAAEAVRAAGAPAHCVAAARQADVSRVSSEWMVGLWDAHVLKRPRGVKWSQSSVLPLPAVAAAEAKADASGAAAAGAADATVCPVTGKSAPAAAASGAAAVAGAGAAAAAAAGGVCPVTGKSAPAAAADVKADASGAGAAADPLSGVSIKNAPQSAEYVVVPVEDLTKLAAGAAGRKAWADAVTQTFTDLGLSLNHKTTPELHARLAKFVADGQPMIDVVAWSPNAKQVTDRPLFSITAPTKATAPHLFA